MKQRQYQARVHQRGAARARATRQNEVPRLLAVLTAGAVLVLGVMASGMVHAQTTVPEVVAPKSASPTLPPNGSATPQPRSENPLADSGAARPVPDGGVLAPTGNPAVIRPPATGTMPIIQPPSRAGTMPIIPPPGSPGGDKSVVPK